MPVKMISIRDPDNPMSDADRRKLHEAIRPAAEKFAALDSNLLRLRFMTTFITSFCMNFPDPEEAFSRLFMAAGTAVARAMEHDREKGGHA